LAKIANNGLKKRGSVKGSYSAVPRINIKVSTTGRYFNIINNENRGVSFLNVTLYSSTNKTYIAVYDIRFL